MLLQYLRVFIINLTLYEKKEPTGLAGGSSLTGITLIVPANALRAYNGLTGRRLLATRKRVKIHC